MPTYELKLIPGLLTTRTAVAKSFGGARFGGIEQAVDSQMVFVYSDPSKGEKNGYVFDGQVEDDEHGPLYLYTGEGPYGDQGLTSGNVALMHHRDDRRTVHLFVADGYMRDPVTNKKTGTARQRYIGQMVVDEVQPFERRRAPDRDGVMRWVYVFHLRPDPNAPHPPRFTPDDAVRPALTTEALATDVEPQESEPEQAPVGPASSQVETEEHTTDETVANIPGGERTIRRREGQLTTAYKAHLEAAGHTVKRFQITVEGVSGTLKTDLYDVTDNVLYEAKGTVRRDDLRMAIGQLRDYRRHIDVPPGLRLAVLLPGDPGRDLRELLAAEDIALVTRTPNSFEGFPLT